MTLRLHIILSRFSRGRAARDVARRWRAARDRSPELATDLMRMGCVMQPVGAPLDPQRLAYEAGRRDLAQEMLALMNISIDELNELAQQE